MDFGNINTIVVTEKAAHPSSCRLRIGPHAHPLSREVVGTQCAALRVVNDCVMLTATQHGRRNEHIGLAMISRLQIGNDR